MILEYEGRQYEYDEDDLSVKQGEKIEAHIGGTLLDWSNGMERASIPCMQALGWLVLYGGDLNIPIASVDFKPMKLALAVQKAQAAEAAKREARLAAGAEPDPTNSPSQRPGQPVTTGSNGLPAALISRGSSPMV